MITDLILKLVYNLQAWLILALPTSSGFPTVFHTGIQYIKNYITGWIKMFNPILDFDVMKYCVLFIFTTEIIIWGFKISIWILSHTRIIKQIEH